MDFSLLGSLMMWIPGKPFLFTQLCSSDLSQFGQIAAVESWSSCFFAYRMTNQHILENSALSRRARASV